MKHTRLNSFRLDISVALGGFLLAEGRLDKVQELLQEHAPKWSAGLYVWRYRQEKTPVDISSPGALAKAVRARAAERGQLFHELERQFGKENSPRIFGSAELRGVDNSLVLIVSLDEEVFVRIGNEWHWGNELTFQVCRARIDHVDSGMWSARILEALCNTLSPIYAHAEMIEEYDRKNISQEGGSTIAIGTDISKSLPGLYWLNFFGKPYRDLIGRERLLSAPAHAVREVDDGVLLALSEDPRDWTLGEYRAAEQQVVNHLGSQYFFSKKEPNRRTVAPHFDSSGPVGTAGIMRH